MALDIKPGSRVHVKIVNQPTNRAASKTLARVLQKDPEILAEKRRIEKVMKANNNPQPRGGRMYGGQMVKLHPVNGDAGEQGKVLATVDVIRDLESVERFIEVTPA